MCSLKVIVASSLINREWLKQGRCSKAKWVMPKQDEMNPCLESLYNRLCGRLLATTVGLSCSKLFSKEWFRLCVVGDLWWILGTVIQAMYCDGRYPSSPAIVGNPFSLRDPTVLFVLPTFVASSWNLMNVTISVIFYLLENPRPYYNITEFPIKCFGQRKVKTFPCLCVGSLT